VTDGQTDGRTELRWLRRANKSSLAAFARKKREVNRSTVDRSRPELKQKESQYGNDDANYYNKLLQYDMNGFKKALEKKKMIRTDFFTD